MGRGGGLLVVRDHVSRVVRLDLVEYRGWLHQLGRAESTIRNYTREIVRVARWLEGRGASLRTATQELMQQWRAGLRVGPSAVRAYVAALRSYYRWAIWSQRVGLDPTRDLPLPAEPKGIPRPIPEDLLIQALINAPGRIRPWLFLAALAGLRACEIAVLRREDIIDTVIVVNGKGGKQRVVPLSPQVWAELVAHGLPASGYLFRRADGLPGPNSRAVVSNAANTYLHGIGIAETLHQLRHRFGTRAFAVHKDLRIVQELMGHASPQTTAGYADFCRTEAITTVAGVQIDLSGYEGQLPVDTAGSKIGGAPHGPVSTRPYQPEPPIVLPNRQLPGRALELPEQHPPADYHQVWKPRRVPPRIVIVKRQQAIPLYARYDLLLQVGLCHLVIPPVPRAPARSSGRPDRPSPDAWTLGRTKHGAWSPRHTGPSEGPSAIAGCA